MHTDSVLLQFPIIPVASPQKKNQKVSKQTKVRIKQKKKFH